MTNHKDEIKTYIPKNTNFLILGTMGSINARTIDGIKPKDFFFYNDSRNHFWKVLQYLFIKEPQKLSISEKKAFIEKYGVAICNIVSEAEVPKKFAHDPSDTVLFQAYAKNKIKFKKANKELKEILKTKPIYFTCREKKGIKELLQGFLKFNNLDEAIYENVHFLKSPTRCNPYKRSLEWIEEMHKF